MATGLREQFETGVMNAQREEALRLLGEGPSSARRVAWKSFAFVYTSEARAVLDELVEEGLVVKRRWKYALA